MDQRKKQFLQEEAMEVANEMVYALSPYTARIIIAGSLRRRRPIVGDVELLFIPTLERCRVGLFVEDVEVVDPAAREIDQLREEGIISHRFSAAGVKAWGKQNKLAIHCATGIPVDFFSTSLQCWFNYLVCRTGPSASNMRVAEAARAKGWQWNPYGPGFSRGQEAHEITSEKDVFDFVGLQYHDPILRI